MFSIRNLFYMFLGFTFPIFWAVHSSGFMKAAYLPLQKLFNTTTTGWPSLVSATIIYLVAAVIFEVLYRLRRDLVD